MESDRRQRIQAVALEALALSAERRAAYLDRACAGDGDLRRDVESLLGGQMQADAFLESPPWVSAAAPLTPGTRLGPYEIEGAIGAGGMGAVYKAKDTRLGRTVALKVLPPGLNGDPERRARFEREAKVVAALSHPHICTLHDVGDHDGALFLVMELLAGETLAVRLEKGPVPLEQALVIGAEVAEALAAAHRQGVIHRDLKPGNVMLTKAGTKLLDFGLAKLTAHGEQPAAASLASAPTQTRPLTSEGAIVGTLQYMAPEQVEGKPTDARTDLWALGAVLYEMLTGKRAFAGDSAAKLIGNIMNAEPVPLSTPQPVAPPSVDRIVRKCLAKQPDDRWDTAHDVADELRWVAQVIGVGAEADARPRGHLGRRIAFVAAGVLAGLMIGAGVMWLVRPAWPGASLVRPSVDVRPADELNARGVSLTGVPPTPGGSRTALTWTPDGQALVFVGRRGDVQQLYIRRLDETEARPLAGTEGAQVPAVSMDGQWVSFWAAGAIRKVRLGGGPVTDLMPGLGDPPRGMAWDDRGRVYFSGNGPRIWQIPADGAPAPVTTPGEAELLHSLPSPLPGAKALLYTVRKRWWSWGDEEVVAQTLASGERKLLLRDAADARYVPTGHLVFMRRGVLFAVAFDPERLEVHGEAVAMFDKVAQSLTAPNNRDIIGAGQFAVASTGTLALIPGPVLPYPDTVLVAVDRHGQVQPLPAPPHAYQLYVPVSRDGRWLAVTIQNLTEVGLWLYDRNGDKLTLLSRDGELTYPIWAPDARQLAFSWVKDGRRSLAVQPADGSAPPRVLVSGAFVPTSWSPDGRHVAGLRSGDITIVTVGDGSVSEQPWLKTAHSEMWAEFSPDGHWLAYGSSESGRFEIYVRPYPGPGTPQQVSFEGGTSPAWNPGGKQLFFLSGPNQAGRRKMMAVEFDGRTTPGRPTPLFAFDPTVLRIACNPNRCFDVAPDGQHFYAVQMGTLPRAPMVTHINLIPNWFEELKANVPLRR